MLTEICQYLRNWFNRKPDGTMYPKEEGVFTIENGTIDSEILVDGQYFRILGSLFNDGVHKYGDADLTDETFSGQVWSMGVPKEVVALSEEIEEWQSKYGSVSNEAMSPFNSESYAGYSYTKSAGGSNSTQGGGSGNGWQNAYATRLNAWRKL